MDYTTPSFRKTRGYKRAKRRYAVYKKGGKYRGANIISDKRGDEKGK